MAKEIPYKIYLEENEMPTQWYNVRADMTSVIQERYVLLQRCTHSAVDLSLLQTMLADFVTTV